MSWEKTCAALLLALTLASLLAMSGPLLLKVHGVLTWSNGTSLTPLLAIDSKPYVMQDAQNKLWLAYESSRSGNFDIYIRWFVDGTWLPEQRLTDSASYDLAPAIEQLANGDVLLAWSSDRSGTYAIWYKINSGGTWSADTQLTFPTGRDANPSLLKLVNGTLWLYWSRETISGQTVLRNLYYRAYNAGVWSADRQFSSGNYEQQPNLLQADDGSIWVTYAANRVGNLNIYYRKFSGATWSAETALSTNTADDRQSWLMQGSDGLLYLFWTRCVPSSGQDCQDDVLYKTSSDQGAIWSVETLFTVDPQGETIADSHPSAVHAKDRMIYVFWGTNLTGLGTDFDVYVSTSNAVQAHDVGVAGMAVAPPILRRGGLVSINVTVTNYGDYPETFQVSVMATNTSSIPVGTQSVSLAPLASMSLTFTWNTAAAPFGRYTITSSIPPVPGEPFPYQSDNSLSVNGARVVPPADVNVDGVVDILDAALIGYSYDTVAPDPSWNPSADVNGDGVVSILDMALIGYSFNTVPGDARWDPRADTNGDGQVSILDAALAAVSFDTEAPDPRWDAMADLNGDGMISILDAALVGLWYGASG